MRFIIFAAILAAAPTAAVAADTAAPVRFALTPTANGYIRLDTLSGQVSECTGVPSNLVCKSTPDERSAMQAEIDRLTKQVDDLKAAAVPRQTADSGPQLNVPSDKDVDKAFNFMDRMIKRFKGLIEEMRKDPAETTPL